MPDIMEIIDERKKQENKDRKKQRNGASYSESARDKWLCCAFKLGFVQLICKGSLIFMLTLELALSIILIERELYKSKHVVVECRLNVLSIKHLIKLLLHENDVKKNF